MDKQNRKLIWSMLPALSLYESRVLASRTIESNFVVFYRLFDVIYDEFASGRYTELSQAFDLITSWENADGDKITHNQRGDKPAQ